MTFARTLRSVLLPAAALLLLAACSPSEKPKDTAAVPADMLRVYDHIRSRGKPDAVVAVVDGHCGSCQITLSPAMLAEVAKLMRDAGLVVFVALVSPYRADRETAAAMFEPGEFLEVYVDTPVEVCSERDPKGLYAKAAAGNLPNMTGVGQGYEPPLSPGLILHGTGDLEASVDTLIGVVLG